MHLYGMFRPGKKYPDVELRRFNINADTTTDEQFIHINKLVPIERLTASAIVCIQYSKLVLKHQG